MNKVNTKITLPPIDGHLLPFRFPPAKTIQLSNGLRLIIVERAGLPKVYLRLGFPFGIKNDPEGREGTAELLANTLKKGTLRRDYQQLVDDVETAGGELDAMVSEDFCIMYGEFISEYLPFGVEILSEMALMPALPENELEKERIKLIANLENEKSSPAFLAQRRMNRALFSPHPYAGFKTAATIGNISRENLLQFHQSHIFPQGAVLVMAGDVSETAAKNLAEKFFADWPGAEKRVESLFAQPLVSQRQIHLVNRPGSEQANILLGNLLFPRNHPDFEKMMVMNKILGGGGSGRLFLNLREEKGFTYGAYSAMQTYRDQGAWIANAEVRTEVTIPSLEAFEEEFQKIKNEPVPEKELMNAKRYLIGVFPLQNETPSSIAALALKQQLNGLPADYWDRYLEALERVDADMVRQMAEEYIRTVEMNIVVVGDAEKLLSPLRELAPLSLYDPDDNIISI
ncbi:MAG: pitrilysin family protein [Calditrichia bacterium]